MKLITFLTCTLETNTVSSFLNVEPRNCEQREDSSRTNVPSADREPTALASLTTSSRIPSSLAKNPAFEIMLRLERRRTNRSSRRLSLRLLNLAPCLSAPRITRQFRRCWALFHNWMRETDIKGWYKEDSVFGVIFTEIGDGDANVITKVLLERSLTALCNAVGIDTLNGICFSFHVLPSGKT